MSAIKEDYVSFETSKLLKEKGFDQNCATYYLDGQVWRHYHGEVIPKDKQIYAAPTQAIAMKYLREVHNLCIEPYRTASGYLYTISKIWTGSEIYSDEFNGDDEDSGQWTTYEKACEAAIKYCLKKLI